MNNYIVKKNYSQISFRHIASNSATTERNNYLAQIVKIKTRNRFNVQNFMRRSCADLQIFECH